jgi:hydrogenase expression/formation protein HypE
MTALPNHPLPPGKVSARLLAELLSDLPTQSPDLLLGPAVGEDAAVIDFAPGSDSVLVAKSDPITFATDEIGYYAVNICVNDLAVTGARPRFYLPTLLLPAGSASEEQVRHIFRQIGTACSSLDIVVAGGHSEITHAVNQPVVAGTLLGEAPRCGFISSGGGRPGDVILMAGVAPVEGTSIIARERRTELLQDGWTPDSLDAAAAYLYDPGISVLVPARIAAETGHVAAMHDPTEGGIATGLEELAVAAQVGLEVDLDAIPIPEVSRALCRHFGLDPLGVIASGALLVTVSAEDAEEILARWRAYGWPAAAIGRLTGGRELVALREGRRQEFPRFHADEIIKLWT